MELEVLDFWELLENICYVGVIFFGYLILEVVGDYLVGLNYILFIFGVVCYVLVLGVEIFLKYFSLV